MSLQGNPILKLPVSRTVAQAILEQLNLYGVKRIYGVIGDAIFGLMDAIARQTAIQFVAVKHESVAAIMASAEAKCAGGLGVCTAQMGPGLANLLNGLGDAFLDRVPVLAITGQAPLKKIGTSYKQFINQQELVQAITGYSQLVVHPDAIMDSLTQAIRTSINMDTVSHLSIPADVFTLPTSVPLSEPTPVSDSKLGVNHLEKGLQMMSSAKSPMILLGHKARSLRSEIQQLADAWGSGIATSYGAVGIFPDSDPYWLGGLGEGGNPHLTPLFQQADVVMAIETTWWPAGQTAESTRVIQVHKKQLNLGQGMPVDCGIVGNPSAVIVQLMDQLKPQLTNQNWISQIRQCKQTWALQNEEEGNIAGYPLHPARVVRAIERCTTSDTVITLDEGDLTLWFMRNFRGTCDQVLLSHNWRTMGFGLPAALAAKMCQPTKQVICLTGDGGIAMVLADLLTAIRYQLGVTVIVLNNGRLQMEYNKMMKQGLVPEGVDLTNPDFVKLAKACGWDALRVRSDNELDQLIETATKSDRPVLLDVPTAQVPYPDYQSA